MHAARVWMALVLGIHAAWAQPAPTVEPGDETPSISASEAQSLKIEALKSLNAHPYRVPWWLRNAHLQTAFPPLARGLSELPFRRERWDTPDDDFLNVYHIDGDPQAPILLLLHGLGGTHQSNYIAGMAARFETHRWHIVVKELRSTGEEINRARRLYHAGETTDLDFVVRRLAAEHPGRPIYIAGISLGGNILGKWLGEQGARVPAEVRATAIESPPFDPRVSSPYFEASLGGRYSRYFLERLVPKALEKERQFPGSFDVEALKQARTLRDFDAIVTAPLHGFADVDAYYAHAGCAQYLEGVRVPTLLICAEDDPFNPPETIPRAVASASPWLIPQWTLKGGHVGFIYGPHPLRAQYWDEEQIERFFLLVHTRED